MYNDNVDDINIGIIDRITTSLGLQKYTYCELNIRKNTVFLSFDLREIKFLSINVYIIDQRFALWCLLNKKAFLKTEY